MIKYWCTNTLETGQIIIARVNVEGSPGVYERLSVKIEKIFYRKTVRRYSVGDSANVPNSKLKDEKLFSS